MKPVGKDVLRAVTVRMPGSQWAAMSAMAGEAGVPLAQVVRVLLGYALAAWRRGDPELCRAVKTSRDG